MARATAHRWVADAIRRGTYETTTVTVETRHGRKHTATALLVPDELAELIGAA
jgi:hypothetical protein